jgi:hypothetical protein
VRSPLSPSDSGAFLRYRVPTVVARRLNPFVPPRSNDQLWRDPSVAPTAASPSIPAVQIVPGIAGRRPKRAFQYLTDWPPLMERPASATTFLWAFARVLSLNRPADAQVSRVRERVASSRLDRRRARDRRAASGRLQRGAMIALMLWLLSIARHRLVWDRQLD